MGLSPLGAAGHRAASLQTHQQPCAPHLKVIQPKPFSCVCTVLVFGGPCSLSWGGETLVIVLGWGDFPALEEQHLPRWCFSFPLVWLDDGQGHLSAVAGKLLWLWALVCDRDWILGYTLMIMMSWALCGFIAAVADLRGVWLDSASWWTQSCTEINYLLEFTCWGKNPNPCCAPSTTEIYSSVWNTARLFPPRNCLMKKHLTNTSRGVIYSWCN